MSDLDKMYIDANAPHMAREHRKTHGYPEGDLTCNQCGASNASSNRQRTAYVNSDNSDILCPSCQKKTDEYWDGMWADHYSGGL